jgi:site-specific DNA recombinase
MEAVIQITELKAKMMKLIEDGTESGETNDGEIKILSDRIAKLKEKKAIQNETKSLATSNINKSQSIITLLDGLKNQPIIYDDIKVRQIIECVRVISETQLEIIFEGGNIVREVSL